jgi:hypothetical protein
VLGTQGAANCRLELTMAGACLMSGTSQLPPCPAASSHISVAPVPMALSNTVTILHAVDMLPYLFQHTRWACLVVLLPEEAWQSDWLPLAAAPQQCTYGMSHKMTQLTHLRVSTV